MNLIIVESPTKAKTLTRFLGDGYSVEATMGHVKDLPKSKISVDIENNYEPQYLIVEKKQETINKIVKEAGKAKKVFLATDPDREGEAISQHILEILSESGKKNDAERITFHEITKEAVEHAIESPGKINSDLVDAQIARRVLDRLVGYNLSPILWKKVRRFLSAGRVQSVVVRLIVEKEQEIEKFKTVEYWEIYCQVKAQKSEVKSEEFKIQLNKIADKKANVSSEQEARAVEADLKNSAFTVTDVIKKEVKKHPFAPFTTSTMTQAAANLFGWSSKYTMRNAQSLYEKGLITYHRTDSYNVSKKAQDEARSYISEKYGVDYVSAAPRIYKTKSKSAQEAHEAIRPTDVKIQDSEIKNQESASLKLYNLIWKRFIASQMADAVFDQTTIKVQAKGNKIYELSVGGQIMKFQGFRKVYGNTSEDVILPEIAQDDPLDLVNVITDQKFTQPPARYNEASLIKMLEKLGIGRPSTYAPTISTIQTRGYVEKKDGKFFPTPVGITVTEFLLKNFPVELEYSFTAKMEDNLDDVAKGATDWHKMIDEFYKPFAQKIKSAEKADRVAIPVEKIGKKCPTCEQEGRTGSKQGELVIRTGRFGKFVSCSLFPDCKHTEKYLQKIGLTCPTCKKGEIIIKKTGKGRQFFGCSRYPDCEYASWKDPRLEKKMEGVKEK